MKKTLTKDQNEVYEKISLSLNHYEPFLLYGITGSGKTEVYIKLVEEVIKNGNKPNWCPLKELPDETHNDEYMDEYCDGYDDGWNSLRKKILGEDEEDK